MEYSRDAPANAGEDAIEQTRQHVRDHLASVADADDDPATLAGRVWIATTAVDNRTIRFTGTLDAEPDAPYLKAEYDPDEAEAAGL